MAGSQISLNAILRHWALEKWPDASIQETKDWWSLRMSGMGDWAVAQITPAGVEYRALVDRAAEPYQSMRGNVWEHDDLFPSDPEYFVKLEKLLSFAWNNTIEQIKVRERICAIRTDN